MWGMDKIMFGQRRRRWANIESTLGQHIAFSGNAWYQLWTYFSAHMSGRQQAKSFFPIDRERSQ